MPRQVPNLLLHVLIAWLTNEQNKALDNVKSKGSSAAPSRASSVVSTNSNSKSKSKGKKK